MLVQKRIGSVNGGSIPTFPGKFSEILETEGEVWALMGQQEAFEIRYGMGKVIVSLQGDC